MDGLSIIDVTITPSEVYCVLLRMHRRKALLFVGSFAFISLLFIIVGGNAWISWTMLLLDFWYLSALGFGCWQRAKLYPPRLRFVFSDSGIHSKTPDSESFDQWAAISSAREIGPYILIEAKNLTSAILPLRNCPTASERAAFRALLRRKLGENARIAHDAAPPAARDWFHYAPHAALLLLFLLMLSLFPGRARNRRHSGNLRPNSATILTFQPLKAKAWSRILSNSTAAAFRVPATATR